MFAALCTCTLFIFSLQLCLLARSNVSVRVCRLGETSPKHAVGGSREKEDLWVRPRVDRNRSSLSGGFWQQPRPAASGSSRLLICRIRFANSHFACLQAPSSAGCPTQRVPPAQQQDLNCFCGNYPTEERYPALKCCICMFYISVRQFTWLNHVTNIVFVIFECFLTFQVATEFPSRLSLFMLWIFEFLTPQLWRTAVIKIRHIFGFLWHYTRYFFSQSWGIVQICT